MYIIVIVIVIVIVTVTVTVTVTVIVIVIIILISTVLNSFSIFFTLCSKPTIFTSLSHHRLLVPYPWTAFSNSNCFLDLVCSFIFFPLFVLVFDPVW